VVEVSRCYACHAKRRTKLCVAKLCVRELMQPGVTIATPATQNEGGCRQVPRLPRNVLCETKLCVTKLCVTKLCVCEEVVCDNVVWCNVVCDKVVCDNVVCGEVVWNRWCVTKLCVKESVLQSCV